MSGLEDRAGLATFLVEHYWPGLTPSLFQAACGRVRLSTDEIAGEGIALRFLHSTLVAEEETAFCVFEAESAAAVEQAYARAAVPFERIVDALEIGIGPATAREGAPVRDVGSAVVAAHPLPVAHHTTETRPRTRHVGKDEQ